MRTRDKILALVFVLAIAAVCGMEYEPVFEPNPMDSVGVLPVGRAYLAPRIKSNKRRALDFMYGRDPQLEDFTPSCGICRWIMLGDEEEGEVSKALRKKHWLLWGGPWESWEGG